jgi:uncharacterized protein
MNKVFVDSGAWIACMNSKDINHKEAVKYLKDIINKNILLMTSNYIIDETITWLRYNCDHMTAVKAMGLLQKAERSRTLEIDWTNKDIAEEAWEIFKIYVDQKLSFTDCTSFALCRKHKIDRVFGFDSDFNILGFLLSPFQVQENKGVYNILRPK